MKIRIQRPIKELLAALPESTLRPDDLTFLTHTRGYIHALRDYDVTDAAIFTNDVRRALALEITGVVADIIETHVPRRAPGRVPTGRPAGRPAMPLKPEIAGFKDALALLALVVDDGWMLPPDERAYAQPRAALDNAFTALLKQADALRLDTDSLTDMWTRLCEGLDAYATAQFSSKTTPMLKTTVVAQLNLVLKILLRDAQGARA